jgi:uncharacterized protein
MTFLLRCAAAAALFVAAAVVPPLAAQQPTPSAATIAAAEELLTTMGMTKQFDAVIPMMMQQIRQIILQANPSATKEVDDAIKALMVKFSQRKNEVIPLAAQVYARRLTIEDMQAMSAFFKTPAGQRYVEMTPQLTQESMMIGQQWGQKLGQEVEQEMRQELAKRGIKV